MHHGHGHAAWTMDIEQGHGRAEGIWTRNIDIA
jgi:hypothetical protein